MLGHRNLVQNVESLGRDLLLRIEVRRLRFLRSRGGLLYPSVKSAVVDLRLQLLEILDLLLLLGQDLLLTRVNHSGLS